MRRSRDAGAEGDWRQDFRKKPASAGGLAVHRHPDGDQGDEGRNRAHFHGFIAEK